MQIVVLAGGIGGARFLLGVREYAAESGAEVTAIGNVGDDVWLHGVRICPDLDSVMYTLGGGIDPQRQWGRADESWTVKAELAAYGEVLPDLPTWFGLGDRDLATHLVRTRLLTAGQPLSAVTAALCERWQPGITLLPATDDRVETHVVLSDSSGSAAIHFQEWWVRHQAALPAKNFTFIGAEEAKPAPGVLDALAAADVVLIAPSNPVVSIAPILAVPGIKDALTARSSGTVIGFSPIIGGAPVRGMADKCLAAIGVQCSAAGVGALYGARRDGGILDTWLVDQRDAGAVVPGVEVIATPLLMTDPPATATMVRTALHSVDHELRAMAASPLARPQCPRRAGPSRHRGLDGAS